jgi:hypothetical protein
MKKNLKSGLVWFILALSVVLMLISIPILNKATVDVNYGEEIGDINDKNNPDENIDDFKKDNIKTKPKYSGMINISGIGEFDFDPRKVKSVRGDIFKPGYFSIFDVLVHLDNNKLINLKYHFAESMNTYLIDSINGKENWWYYAYYDGGWRERNAFRMDHYPYKDNTTIIVFQEYEEEIEDIYEVFTQEITRKAVAGGRVIIPNVKITGETIKLNFKNVEVTAHNLRNDSFQDGVITAIDVIMSLGDQGKLDYELKWYESIGTAKTVKNYWVHRINGDEAYGKCGFVYEAGSNNFKYSRNHIHIPSDSRIINSPEYEEWFWICL